MNATIKLYLPIIAIAKINTTKSIKFNKYVTIRLVIQRKQKETKKEIKLV